MNHRVIHRSLLKIINEQHCYADCNLLFFNDFKSVQKDQPLKKAFGSKKLSTEKIKAKKAGLSPPDGFLHTKENHVFSSLRERSKTRRRSIF